MPALRAVDTVVTDQPPKCLLVLGFPFSPPKHPQSRLQLDQDLRLVRGYRWCSGDPDVAEEGALTGGQHVAQLELGGGSDGEARERNRCPPAPPAQALNDLGGTQGGVCSISWGGEGRAPAERRRLPKLGGSPEEGVVAWGVAGGKPEGGDCLGQIFKTADSRV